MTENKSRNTGRPTRRAAGADNKTVTFRLPPDVDEALEDLSVSTGKTRSRIVTDALIAHALPQLKGVKK